MTHYKEEDVAHAFGKTVRAARVRRGLSQETFARAAGFDRAYPSRLERGVSVPTLTSLFRVAEGLGVKASQLMGDVENRFVRSGSAR